MVGKLFNQTIRCHQLHAHAIAVGDVYQSFSRRRAYILKILAYICMALARSIIVSLAELYVEMLTVTSYPRYKFNLLMLESRCLQAKIFLAYIIK